MKKLTQIFLFARTFLRLAGSRHWYRGNDKPNLWQWLYAWRISPKTAWQTARIIWFEN